MTRSPPDEPSPFDLPPVRRTTHYGGRTTRYRIDGRVFASGILAAKFYGVSPATISAAANRGRWRGMTIERIED